MMNYGGKFYGKKSKQVFRPIGASAHGSTGAVLASEKHRSCAEIEFVDPEEEIVWNGSGSFPGTCIKRFSTSEEAQNVVGLPHIGNEPLSGQKSNAAPRHYAVLRDLLESTSTRSTKLSDHSGDISNVDASKGTKRCGTRKKSVRQSNHKAGSGGYKFVEKTSVPTEKLNKIKKANHADFACVQNVQHEYSDCGQVRRQGARQRDSFLFWIARQGIEEGEITIENSGFKPDRGQCDSCVKQWQKIGEFSGCETTLCKAKRFFSFDSTF
ncbi:hypothetical protein L7F22_016612 [Adiantum nelumboides]|nr:hypothetical protein [Adiantum nelumboides]